MKPTRTLGPFGGLVSAVDPSIIPEHCAQDMLNMTVEDGKLKLRRSYRQVAAWDNTISACYGLGYLLGFNASNVEQEEFITVVTKSGNTRPYKIHPTTGAMTVLTNGVSNVALSATPWHFVPFDADAYAINTNDTNPVWKHAIGTNDSFAPVTVAVDSPTDPLVATVVYSSADSQTAYATQSWTGLTVGTAITNNSANVVPGSSSVEGDNLKVAITSASTAAIPFNFDITHLASKDYSYCDLFIFKVALETVGVTGTLGNELSPTESLKFSFYNGSAYIGASVQWDRRFEGGLWVYYAYVSMQGASRGSRTITRIKVEGTLHCKNPWLPLTYLHVFPYWVGMVDCASSTNATASRKFAYSYINTAQNDETELFGTGTAANPWVTISNSILRGFSPYATRPSWRLGCWVKETVVASSDASVDKNRLYVEDSASWRRFAEFADGGTSPTEASDYFRLTREEVQDLPIRSNSQPGPFPNMVWAFTHKGHMVWLKKGGQQNIVHSGTGQPERLPSTADLLDDDTRPGQYTLGDNYAEEPVAGLSAGGVCFIFGDFGVFTQIGDLPSAMTPLRRVAGSKGILNPFAQCVWRDESGNPGAAFATRDGIFFISAAQDFQGENDPVMDELSADIRDRLGADTLVPVKDDVRLFADENSDALWVAWSNKAYVLRRPSLVDSLRRWEYYEYRLYSTDTSFKYFASPNRYGPRALSNVGHMCELEFDSSNNVYMDTAAYQFYEGTESPALLGFPAHYWVSKDLDGPNRRVRYIQLSPVFTVSANGAAPKVTVGGIEGAGTATRALGAGTSRRTINFGPGVQGRSLNYKIWQESPSIAGNEGYEFSTVDIWESQAISARRTA